MEPIIVIVALDVEDTITSHSTFFAFLSNALVDAGHTVIVITLRDDRDDVAAELDAYGVRYTELVTADEDVLARPDVAKWKGEVCRDRGVEIFFEDTPEIIKHVGDSVLTFLPI